MINRNLPPGRSTGGGHGEQDQEHPQRDLLRQDTRYRQWPEISGAAVRCQQETSLTGESTWS